MTQAPVLSEASTFAGDWRISGRAGDCLIRLLAEDEPVAASSLAAPMYAIEQSTNCPALGDIRGWRPIPLGLELTNADGAAVVIFEGVDAQTYGSIDQAWTLRRG